MPGDVLLTCGECGCASDERAWGWAAFTREDPDGLEPTSVEPTSVEPTSVVIMCPVCVAREFEWKPEIADSYV